MPCPLCRYSLRTQILSNPPPGFNIPPPSGLSSIPSFSHTELVRLSIHIRLQIALSMPHCESSDEIIRAILEEVRVFEETHRV